MDPYEELANAIIVQAAKDYRLALHKEDLVRMFEVEHFFRSRWFGQLTSVDPEYLISRLRKEHEDDGRKDISRSGLPH